VSVVTPVQKRGSPAFAARRLKSERESSGAARSGSAAKRRRAARVDVFMGAII